ncbi:acetate--CoA ligase [Aquirufa antheringensis]|uniref:Acetate--CoA ligase n=1 Tax=Aquirufa antheringensis TaxID=2516559 RepID=A0A4Q9B951_9BACT|nr:acetate--CoA ligase [Aquirufa antheringensis]MCZ2485691.1 acetate--CoA ligase [Aquirufa antheringensis]MCZ2486616.1 acetate--CoA ligase [Aquirufa antheringensis]MCZ2488603.1 acetate--CoA ligase [Aquirufa antheringensis]TBH71174.1 acetate--CoA ligase [Aquirufa antheringensis]
MRITSLQQYHEAYEESVQQPEKFWAGIANQFDWIKPFTKVLDWNFDDYSVKWFEDGQMNITANALDRHLKTIPDQAAIIYEPNEPGDEAITLTYRELHARVCKFSNVLKNQGVVKGDRVCIYMPMIPELAIAVLACARIGAIHSVVFGGFSAQSIADRINDSECKVVVTTDGAVRGNKTIPMKETVDDALVTCPSVEKVIVKTRTKTPVSMIGGRDLWWEQEENEASADCPAEAMNAEDPLFILYTSGSTGKPKGVVHTCGGYMVYTAYTFANVFQYKPGEVFFCTADIGWITGHSYLVYGPLLNGAKSVLFEGIPTYPDAGRFWDIIKRHSVNIFYTAPTAIRSLMGFGDEHIEGKDLSSLRVLGSVGEPLNEEAWHWYNDKVGHGNCPIVDTWWQTETGGLMISPIAGITPLKPAFATLPLPGVQPILVDENGKEITGNGVNGNLCIKYPWPSIIRTTYGDHERCKSTYFSTYPGLYFTGDGCMRDEDGYYRITGRVDDVMNISGHRIGTAEVENAINMHTGVIESAVVGYPHDIKGQGIYAYVICEHPTINDDLTRKDILATVTRVIGPIAKPDKIQFVTGLPKTRSGKIMRRILRKVAEGDTTNLGDTSTLLDPGVVDSIISGAL